MTTAENLFARLVADLRGTAGVEAGQMFGKPCAKIGGKAFVAQHLDRVVFKLSGDDHTAALALPGAMLWDPSGKGRPMKEWLAVPATTAFDAERFAKSALGYVAALT
jgi:hypothetical protein